MAGVIAFTAYGWSFGQFTGIKTLSWTGKWSTHNAMSVIASELQAIVLHVFLA